MKTTSVRKLLPEAWGFLCPVHTPDGSPCGLLNHITLSCVPLAVEEKKPNIHEFRRVLVGLGMQAIQSDFSLVFPQHYLPVILDGVPLGYIEPSLAKEFVKALRALKIQQTSELPKTMEVAFLPPAGKDLNNKQFPGVFLSTTVARFVRPVRNLETGGTEWIGPLEQVNLSIACLQEDLRPDTTHQEIDPLNILSIIASTVPFCEYNQSPRNMYQCQMAK